MVLQAAKFSDFKEEWFLNKKIGLFPGGSQNFVESLESNN
jgi:hypothetical protein